MPTKEFSIGSVIKFGWKTFRENTWFLISFFILVWLLPAIPHAIGSSLQSNAPFLASIFYILQFIIHLTVSLGTLKMGLAFANGQKGSYEDLYRCFSYILNYFIASVLYALILIAGFILLIFPAFIWGPRYYLFGYFIFDKNAGPIEALKMSAQATQGAKWDILSFILINVLLTMAGIALIILGLLIALPVLLVAQAMIYRKLSAFETKTAETRPLSTI